MPKSIALRILNDHLGRFKSRKYSLNQLWANYYEDLTKLSQPPPSTKAAKSTGDKRPNLSVALASSER